MTPDEKFRLMKEHVVRMHEAVKRHLVLPPDYRPMPDAGLQSFRIPAASWKEPRCWSVSPRPFRAPS
jgi:hypothetical protein